MATDPLKRDAALDEVWPAASCRGKRKRAEEFIEEEEGATNRFGGWLGSSSSAVAVVMSLFHLYPRSQARHRSPAADHRHLRCGRCTSASCCS